MNKMKNYMIYLFLHIIFIILSRFYSFFIYIPILLLLFLIADKYFKIEHKIKSTKLYNTISTLLYLRKLKKQSKSINQSQVFLGKYLLNLPIEENEEEVKSFIDIKNYFGEKWPFMVPVKNTRNPEVTVRDKKVKCISSYSYLDLCRDQRVQNEAINSANLYSTGNHGPRMLCGNLEILENLEKRLAKFYGKESALVFSSGYLACMSTLAGIARKKDMLLMDKLCHASLKAGAKLSGAQIVTFKHNDFADAEKQIKKHKYNRLIMVIEGVYSMDGDIGNLPEARRLCDKYNGILILDEAHSMGTLGKTGRGCEEHYDYKYVADVVCGSFTKSAASVGGFLACSKDMRDFYTFYGPGVVFSAPLSAYHAGAADKALEIIMNEPERVKKLQDNSEYLRSKFIEKGFNIGDSITCVIPVIFKDTIQCLRLHHWMLENGFFSSVVMAPACPVTAPRFRITASSAMDNKDMDEIVDIFVRGREAVQENPNLKELTKYL